MQIEFSGLPALGPGPQTPLDPAEFVLAPEAPEFEVFGHDVNAQHAAAADPIQSQAQVIRVTVSDIASQIKFCFQHLLSAVRVIPSIVKGHPLEDLELMVSTHREAVHQLRKLEEVMDLEPGAETVLANPSPTPPPVGRRGLVRRRPLPEFVEERLELEESVAVIERRPVLALPTEPPPPKPPRGEGPPPPPARMPPEPVPPKPPPVAGPAPPPVIERRVRQRRQQ